MSLWCNVKSAVVAGLMLVIILPVAGFGTLGEKYTAAERLHWAFRPRANPVTPKFTNIADQRWAKNPIDAFILQKLKEQGLDHAPRTDNTTLIRRVYFDLTGLPPSPADVRRFVADVSPNAYERLVDRLLASPQYAEHWAQHWLDVVRFAESDGFEYDTHRTEAWRYRDYVIQSFADDKPYDQFMREQLAGDEIDPEERRDAASPPASTASGRCARTPATRTPRSSRNEDADGDDQRGRRGVSRRDARLRALPRSQVRPHPADAITTACRHSSPRPSRQGHSARDARRNRPHGRRRPTPIADGAEGASRRS